MLKENNKARLLEKQDENEVKNIINIFNKK